ncbi:MoxR family ATPase [uncultured Candidatus Kuenenia sp.]|jgi:MoxR-like ATPase|uniref:AAA family ATPase n=1 Tax=uncultured Candidatus Kuenenia sp. TaxID=1048336 RepID=UPI00030829BC|nr:MoxR family ATPase [uncultured Candidatus Kuenenia sp.]
MDSGVRSITERVKTESDLINTLLYEVGKVIVGQKYLIERLLIGMLSNGHVLLEGVPGLAKTMSIMTLAKAMHASFQRIQFTPDLLPADLLGTLIYNPKSGEFTVRKGPVFTNIVLADEINRAPAKVQSALLEAMQDREVTIGDETFKLEEPFLVLATQNPIEHEGTYPLPEAQLDRFMLKLNITYPDKKEEREILERMATTKSDIKVNSVISPNDILRLRTVVDGIYIDDKIKDYIIDIVFASREPKTYNLDLDQFIEYGASPRATINLTLAAKAHAFLKGRGFVTPQDVKSIGMDVLRHRIIITYEAEAEEIRPEDIINKIFDNVEVP